MTRALSTCALIATLAVTRAAWPCGGGFGAGLEIAPNQTIVVGWDGTTETYVFTPHFCGAATSFGLILPVPATLSGAPSLGDAALVAELESLTAPVYVHECSAGGAGCSDAKMGVGGDRSTNDWSPQVAVVDAGTVGIFDWTLLQAETAAAFSDWLDANGFPYNSASASAFDYYVTRSWYFVAFKVTAGAAAPPAGSKLCGDLGPLVLRFAATQPVVPARIAAVNQSNEYTTVWRIYTLAADQLESASPFTSELRFAGTLSADDLADAPALAAMAGAGMRVTKLDLYFWDDITDDVRLQVTANPRDFRQTIVVYEECGCVGVSSGVVPVLVVAAATTQALALLARRRRKQGPH